MKRAALVLLTLQNVSTVLLSRYIRSRPGDMFISSTAVAMSELVKLLVCLIVILVQEGFSLRGFISNLRVNIFSDCRDNLLIGVPGILYAVQNNLLFLSVSHLNASVFQVTYQLKLFTTAIFFRILMKKILTLKHWGTLVLLFIGVVLAQADSASQRSHSATNSVVACTLSGFAGVFFELVLKSTKKTIIVRNIQLSVYGIATSLISVFIQDKVLVTERGFFFGYDGLVWLVIFIQSLGGLLVAAVVCYADNILKNFSTSVAIIMTLLLSVVFLHHSVTWFLVAGNIFVIGSTVLYNMLPPPAVQNNSGTSTDSVKEEPSASSTSTLTSSV
ncbi:unnamed protein product [Dibothriocephalus latus]|uniref:Sugar phosphate transporter domain-containing protein n=1 Tax=Dibothriocephalus latus TaxID=60516 RepID=A0A3P7LA39_DIBLA|nr:unnamed protein product [Dibothriocephalus latus]